MCEVTAILAKLPVKFGVNFIDDGIRKLLLYASKLNYGTRVSPRSSSKS